MNRLLNREASLNTPIREDVGRGEWQDWLIDERDDQEAAIAEGDEFDTRRKALSDALSLLNPPERRIFERRRLASRLARMSSQRSLMCDASVPVRLR